MKKLRSLFLLFGSFLVLLSSTVSGQESVVDGFDFPMGAPEGLGYGVERCGGLAYLERYDYQKDGVPEFHPGEDWNDDNSGKDFGGDRNDKGDPVYAIANGRVLYAKFSKPSWGNIVLIEHTLRNGNKVWSQYAHLKTIETKNVEVGRTIARGKILGTVGDYPSGSRAAYHLHFEIRKKYRDASAFVSNWPKAKVEEYYYNPSEFIRAHRPVGAQEITLSTGENSAVNISWEASKSENFASYQLYRSEISGGTIDETKRTLIFSTEDKTVTSFIDTKAPGPKTYYYSLLTTYKNGQVGISQEKSIEQKRLIIQLTDNQYLQMYPRVYGNRIYWQDWTRDSSNKAPKLLYYYDLEKNERGSIDIPRSGAGSPISNGSEVCYNTSGTSSGMDIFCYSYESNSSYPVVDDSKDQFDFDLSEEGIVVWTDTRNGNADIYYLDLKVATGRQDVVVASGTQANPAIWKNTVVWRDGRRGGNKFDLYYKELGGQERLLVQDCGAGAAPSFWEDWVVWSNNGKTSIINIKTKTTKVIEQSDSNVPRIRDGKIVYQKQEGEGAYIWVYDIETSQKTKIDFSLKGGWFSFPDIYGDVIVWAASKDGSGTDLDIYMTRI